MENMGEWELRNLINELLKGRELARQLQLHLNVSSSSSSNEVRELLLQKILASYEKVLSMLHISSTAGDPTAAGIRLSESPPSLNGSPRSEDSDRDIRDQENRDQPRKKSSLPRWTQKLRVSPGMGLEGTLDDGFSWRKYGQKDILGARHPRGYYRCTHRNVQGCQATKQVQRSDEDPAVFEITYRGRHTCSQVSNVNSGSAIPENQEPNTNITGSQQQDNSPLLTQPAPQQILSSFREGLTVITENLSPRESSFPPFQFPSHIDNSYVGQFSPPFVSPATSGTSYFSGTLQELGGFNGNQNFQPESQLAGIMSAAGSTTSSPTVGVEFPFGQNPMDPNFTFDNQGFFS